MDTENTPPTESRTIVVSRSAQIRLKLAAAYQGQSMREFIDDLVLAWLNDNAIPDPVENPVRN